MSAHLEKACDSLLSKIRKSGLNFIFNETPFSIYVTVRKSFSKSFTHTPEIEPVEKSESLEIELEKSKKIHENLLANHANLKEAYLKIDLNYKDAIGEFVTKNQVIEELKNINDEKTEKIKSLESNIKKLGIDRAKFENVSTENKTLRKGIEELKSEIKVAKKEFKYLVTEKRDTAHNFDKKIEALEFKNKKLIEYKTAEVKKDKVDKKIASKKLKKILEKEAKFEIERMKFEKDKKLIVPSETKYCQTNEHPDLPYKITSPLPPIFSSQLCHATPPVHFLSRSLPRLDKIAWTQPEDYMVDEAEEFLNYQYDQEIKHYYEDAKQQAHDRRKKDMNKNEK